MLLSIFKMINILVNRNGFEKYIIDIINNLFIKIVIFVFRNYLEWMMNW